MQQTYFPKSMNLFSHGRRRFGLHGEVEWGHVVPLLHDSSWHPASTRSAVEIRFSLSRPGAYRNTQPVAAPGRDGSMAQAKTAPPELTGGQITQRAATAQLMPSAGGRGELRERAPSSRTRAPNPSERARQRAPLHSSPFFAPPPRYASAARLRRGNSGELVVDWRW